jgi:serine/threonine protein kinase
MFESRSCPSEDVLLALLEERVDESLHSDVLEHAEVCERCSLRLQQLADSWSLGGLARAASAGHETLAIEQHLVDSPPNTPQARVVVPEQPPVLEGYADLELVSSGGMGVVYRGRDTTLNRSVAIKLLSVHASSSQRLWQRADREARMLARLAHPNVVAIYETGRWGDIPYLVMEWIPGVTLRERLSTGPLDDRSAAVIARQIAGALADAHAVGIVHRDLKPDNILLAPPTAAVDEETPKLIDFGLARTDDLENALTREGSVVGTPSYMAAEQTGLDPTLGGVGPATDIHGIGAVPPVWKSTGLRAWTCR